MPTHPLFPRLHQRMVQEKKGIEGAELNFQILLYLFPLQFGIAVLGGLKVVSASCSCLD